MGNTQMGYYSQNPHYLSGETNEEAERLERAEEQAGRWFADATKPQTARYNERMDVARAYRGAPRWDREKAAADREFAETTAEATALFSETIEHYLANGGEVLEALADRWEALAAKTNETAACWTAGPGDSHTYTRDGRTYGGIARMADGRYCARRPGFVDTLIGYSDTLAHAKARVEAEAAPIAQAAE